MVSGQKTEDGSAVDDLPVRIRPGARASPPVLPQLRFTKHSLLPFALPHPAGVLADHRISSLATECMLKVLHVLDHAINSPFSRGMRIGGDHGALQFGPPQFAP